MSDPLHPHEANHATHDHHHEEDDEHHVSDQVPHGH